MTIQTMQAVWNHSKAEGRARVVLLAIADHQGEMGAWPSIATLAKMANASERSVQRDIQKLIELGELEVRIKAAPTRSQYRANLYWVTLPEVTNVKSEVTDWDSEVTESRSEVTPVGVLNLNRTLNRNIISDDDFEKPKSATRLSEDWWPDDDAWEAMRQRYPQLDLTLITESFKDYWISLPGTRARKLDWLRTWQGRVREVAGRTHGFKPKREEINLWDMTAEND